MQKKKEINIQIGERIKRSREASGYTQEKFSEAIDVSIQYISDLERGKVGTSIATLLKICKVLCVSSDYLLFGKQETNDLSATIERLKHLPVNQLELVEEGINTLLKAFVIGQVPDASVPLPINGPKSILQQTEKLSPQT